MDTFDYETAIGNLLMLHRPERWQRALRWLRYKRTGIGGRMHCACGHVTGPGETFEYHQSREVLVALRKLGCQILSPPPYRINVPLRLT